MTYSFNEIETTMRKAALGLGWPEGIADNFGRAAVYLEKRGISGIEPILSVLQRGPVSVSPEFDSGAAVFRERSGLAEIAAFDLLAACVVRRVELVGACDIDALIGSAGVAAKEYACGFLLEPDRNSAIEVYESHVSLPERRKKSRGGVSAALLPRKVLIPEIAERREINSAAWNQSLAMAALTLVPSTDSSRRLGAGAGLRDND